MHNAQSTVLQQACILFAGEDVGEEEVIGQSDILVYL